MVRAVSVVIPLYNKAPWIERALQSVVKQTVSPEEIIVVDDGSSDGGADLVARFPAPGLRLIRQPNQGVSAARNRGIKEAQGDLIAFLDADDAWKPRFLEVILELKKKYPQAGLYATAYEVVTPYCVTFQPAFKILPMGVTEGLINYVRAADWYPLNASTVAIPKQVLAEVGGFPEGETWTEDLDLWLRVALRYPVAWTRDYLATYYQNVSHRSIHSNWTPVEPVVSRTARKALRAGLVPPEDAPYLQEYAARIQLDAARRCLEAGAKDLARTLLAYAAGTREYGREWRWLRLLAALPGNAALAWLAVRTGLKEASPCLARLRHRLQLTRLYAIIFKSSGWMKQK